MGDEEALLAAIADDPADLSRWLVLADWLDERSDPRGELVRVHIALRSCEPRNKKAATLRAESRLRELLEAGVRPCVPRLVNSVGMELHQIPPGRFEMGSPRGQAGRDPDEVRHVVTITHPFWFAITPVTQGQFTDVMGSNPSRFKDVLGEDTSQFPAESVQWPEAVEFCRRLSEQPEERAAGREYRLPTEAEWEYACRAGVPFPQLYHFGPSVSVGQANFQSTDPHPPGEATGGKPIGRPCRVGRYTPNAWGLFDLHGNVGEWCSDWRGAYDLTDTVDPQGPPTGLRRVLRGGLWNLGGKYCRSASRDSLAESGRNESVGFRIVCICRGE